MRSVAWALALLAMLAWPPSMLAASTGTDCHFHMGFATLHDALPGIVGDCINDETYAANGDSVQHAARGLLVWRKADNLAAFSDGHRSWVNGPNGIQQRLNSERFPFEHDTLSQADLEFRLFDALGPPLYCDPDFYPIARADEQSLALARFPQIQQDALVYQAILNHEHLDPTTLTDTQKFTIYRDYKQLNALQLQPRPDGSFTFNAEFGTDRQNGVRAQGTITAAGDIQVASRQPAPFLNCPICLARGTAIATPDKNVPVEELKPGMLVWTLDRSGRRVAAPVLATGSTLVGPWHRVVDVRLADGREVHASAGHPTADGRHIGQLRPGDVLDRLVVLTAANEPYAGGATFDLLPAGETGVYFAGGIPLRSTLSA